MQVADFNKNNMKAVQRVTMSRLQCTLVAIIHMVGLAKGKKI